MIDVFDGDDNLIANIPVSDRQLAVLEAGGEIGVTFHTPQLLHYVLGQRNGSFMLQRKPSGRVVARDAERVKELAQMLADIAKAKAGN
jgi:hypothetical protein